jgi:hypothetical protein
VPALFNFVRFGSDSNCELGLVMLHIKSCPISPFFSNRLRAYVGALLFFEKVWIWWSCKNKVGCLTSRY